MSFRPPCPDARRPLRIAVAIMILGSLAACAGAALTHSSYMRSSYEPAVLNYAASRGGLLTTVVGNPFDGPKADVERAVTGTFERSHFGQHLPFFTEPPAGHRSPYRVVVVFDPAYSGYGEEICQDGGRSQAPATRERVDVEAAFCEGTRRLTGVGGSIGGVRGPDDPAFRRLLGQIALDLFPPVNPEIQRGDPERVFPL